MYGKNIFDDALNEGGVAVDEIESTQNQTFEKPQINSYLSVEYIMPEHEGRELLPGSTFTFDIPEEFKGRILRDVVLRHRKANKYAQNIGSDGYDPNGAYSRVEAHDIDSGEWKHWSDPHGYSPDKFAEPRPESDPENEVLHDWIATVGKVRPDTIRVSNVGKHPTLSVSQIHGIEAIFFPEAGSTKTDERIYCKGTKFIDIEANSLLPRYGGGEHTNGIYENSIALNKRGSTNFNLTETAGEDAEILNGKLIITPKVGEELIQIEIAVGDTENRGSESARLGWAKLWAGIKRVKTGEIEWFIKNANIPPQGILVGGPHVGQGEIEEGDKIIVESRADTAYLMGWRLTYKKK